MYIVHIVNTLVIQLLPVLHSDTDQLSTPCGLEFEINKNSMEFMQKHRGPEPPPSFGPFTEPLDFARWRHLGSNITGIAQ